MKKLILFAAVLFAGVSMVNAASPTPTDQVNLKVKMKGILSIEVKSGEKDILLEYITPEDYEIGVSTEKLDDHLKVFSNQGFIVNVKGETTDNYSLSNIKIKSEASATRALEGVVSYGEVALAATDKQIFTSDARNLNRNIAITYSGAKDSEFTSADQFSSVNDVDTEHVILVTYTISTI